MNLCGWISGKLNIQYTSDARSQIDDKPYNLSFTGGTCYAYLGIIKFKNKLDRDSIAIY